LLRIDSGDDSFMRTKVKTPTLAQNARMGHPNFNSQNLNTRTSTPKISTLELQYPKPQHSNFNTQNLDTQTSKPGIQNHKEVCVELPDAAHGTFYLASTFRLILMGTRLAFG